MSAASLLLYAAPGFPLALTMLALFARLRGVLLPLLPAAPLPALATALLVPSGTTGPLPTTLLGAGLMLDESGRIFLGVAALLWSLAGFYARFAVTGDGRKRFAGFWLATLTGNLLVIVAADLISFYLSFAILSLAAFGLIIHSGSEEARRAGQVYLVLAIFGETCLLLGFLIGADAANSVFIAEVRAAIPASPHRDLVLGLLVAGFGLKAGLMPLHVWLPLAHPAAPVPASAVLSGAIVNAGIFGLLRFLPLEADLPGWSAALVGMGLATAYIGVAIGFLQRRPKTVLAYSTLSQMGLVIVVLGSAFGSPGPGIALAAATFYTAHHSLAKGALFLSVGVVAETGRKSLPPIMLTAGLAALAIAGLPFTGGALAKLAIKGPLGEGTATVLVTISAVGTTLLMLRFLQLLRGTAPEQGRARIGLLGPFFACVVGAVAVPWLLFPNLTEFAAGYAFKPANLWGASWPVLTGVALLAGIMRLRRRKAPSIPEGDLVVLLERGASAALRTFAGFQGNLLPRVPPVDIARFGHLMEGLEQRLASWRFAGTLLLLVAASWLIWFNLR